MQARSPLERLAVGTDAKLSSVESRLLAEIDRRLKTQTWFLVSALIAGLGVFGALCR